ncbi:MAG TPA: hypothetical protein VK573_02780 [Gemmatimonadales bacterium]|nr:hypothetical protein [Gemmatimonadales bacterium]
MATRKVYTYLLRTTGPKGESYGGFVWPLKKGAIVKAPDWSPRKFCGNGLHGLVMGVGAGGLLNWSEDAKWFVLKVRTKDVVVLDNEKAKVPRAEVAYVGTRDGAVALLLKLGGDPELMVGGLVTASGYAGQATASGDQGQATASGDAGQATASGYAGQATASGYAGQATASGDRGQASASGYQGQASASGYRGQASASGDQGQASASGKNGVALARRRVMAGTLGLILGLWWDGQRDRAVVGYVGENGIKADTWYEVSASGAFVEVVEA